MSGFVTYAQNFEDLMIWRAVRDVGEGFYIDVGAADPDEDSVTRAFYDRGWHGINIEPSPAHFAALSAARPRDINLDCLVGATAGQMIFYNIPETGLSTVNRKIVKRHAADGFEPEEINTLVRTLADICTQFAPPQIHFLKIDVEGAEESVLLGADFNVFRPWIVVIEATAPMSQDQNWTHWDPLLLKAGYRFVWFDGLNRYYIAAEQHSRLAHAFQTPPNVFDGWLKPRGQQQMLLMRQLASAEDEKRRLRMEVGEKDKNVLAELHAARAECSAFAQEAAATRAEAASLRVAAANALELANAARSLQVAYDACLHTSASTQRQLGDLQRQFIEAEAHGAALTADMAQVANKLSMASAMLDAMHRSTSWRITAPLRSVRWFVAGGRRPSTNPQGMKFKDILRLLFRKTITLALLLPGGHRLSRLVYVVAPAPVQWLSLRYRAYIDSATELKRPHVAAVVVPQATDTGPPTRVPGLSAEESRIYTQLLPDCVLP